MYLYGNRRDSAEFVTRNMHRNTLVGRPTRVNNIVQPEIVICNILFFFNLVTVEETAHALLDMEDIVVDGVEGLVTD